tara:strand:+ start:705 stop:932 length:228 start_codon:yes stop_codon:yes gene_type:complete
MKYIYIDQYNEFQIPLVSEILTDQNISFEIKQTYTSSLSGGWMNPGSSYNSRELFVAEKDLEKTKKILSNIKTQI